MLHGKLISDHYTKLSSSLQREREGVGNRESNLLRYTLGNVAVYFAQWGAQVFKNQFYLRK